MTDIFLHTTLACQKIKAIANELRNNLHTNENTPRSKNLMNQSQELEFEQNVNS